MPPTQERGANVTITTEHIGSQKSGCDTNASAVSAIVLLERYSMEIFFSYYGACRRVISAMIATLSMSTFMSYDRKNLSFRDRRLKIAEVAIGCNTPPQTRFYA